MLVSAQAVVREHRSQLMQLRSLADRDLYSLLAQLEGADGVQVRRALIEVLPELVAPYTAASGELAAVLFEDLRAEAGRRGVFYAESAGITPGADRVSKTARWAVTPMFDEALDSTVGTRLSGAIAKMVMDASRDTIEANSVREKIGYQRMARPGCCAFCGLLAAKGSDYFTRASASSGSHDDCRCVVVPVYSGTEMGELARVERDNWERKYRQSLTDEDGRVLSSPKDILAEWRKYHGAK